jgi:hypothetical protein
VALEIKADLQSLVNMIGIGYKLVNIEAEKPEDFDFSIYPPSPSVITKYHLSLLSSNKSLESWVLPKEILSKWPNMKGDEKQELSLGAHIIFRRIDRTSLARERVSMEYLKNIVSVIWIGLSGIGKSMSTVIMLVQALEMMRVRQLAKDKNHLDIPDGFDIIYYRLRDMKFRFIWNSVSASIEVEVLSEPDWIKAAGSMRASVSKSVKPILIVEMAETERDPVVPGLYSSSSRRVFDDVFKTFYKGGGFFFLIDPPCADELRMMYMTLSTLDKDSLPNHVSDLTKFNHLLNEVGPIPRILFTNDEGKVDNYLDERKNLNKDPLREVEADLISISNVGAVLKYFMAPYVREGVEVPRIGLKYSREASEYLRTLPPIERARLEANNKIYEFRALSEGSKVILAQTVKTPKQLQMLQEVGNLPMLLEATVKYAGALDTGSSIFPNNVEARCRLENWRWYQDPGPICLAKRHELIDKKLIDFYLPRYKRCDKVKTFDGMFLNMNVLDMEEKVLYCSTAHNFAVLDWLMVDHRRKKVYGHQVTKQIMVKHDFNIDTIDILLNKLGMLDGTTKVRDYKLVMIGVIDSSTVKPTGMVFSKELSEAEQDAILEAKKSALKHKKQTIEEIAMAKNRIRKKISEEEEEEEEEVEKTVYLGLTDWKKRLKVTPPKSVKSVKDIVWSNADRVESVLARVPIFEMPEFILPEK